MKTTTSEVQRNAQNLTETASTDNGITAGVQTTISARAINSHQITSADGEHAQLLLTESVGNTRQSVILCLPAMGVPARKYLPLAEALNSRGWASAIFELRGIDTSSVRASHRTNFGYHEILNLDLPEAIAEIRQHYPDNPIYLLGHSLGGQLGVLYMGMNPHQIAGFIGVATGTPYFRGWKFPHNLNLLVLSRLMKVVATMVGYFPGRKFGFAGREARQLIKDWAYTVTSGQYRIKSRIKSLSKIGSGVQEPTSTLEAKIQHLKKSVLMLTIAEDFLAPQTSIQHLGSKLANSKLNYAHLVASDFAGDSLGHFNWMKEPEPVVRKIVEWMAENYR